MNAPALPRSTPWLLFAALTAVAAGAVFGFLPQARTFTFAHGYFVVDATSRLFVLLINFVFLGVATHVFAGVRSGALTAERSGVFVGLAVAFIVAANLAVASNHLILMWVFLEWTTLAATPLFQHGGGQAARAGAWKYFLFSGVGLALAMLGFACLARGSQTIGVEPDFFGDSLASHASLQRPDLWHRLGLVLLLLGFGTKLGLAPMFAWLPDTYEVAPASVTALLAAVQFNVALVAVLRVLMALRPMDPQLVTSVLMVMGLATMVMSSAGMIVTKNYKRLIAYASLNHGGVIAIGLGMGRAASYGVMLYVVSNAIIKAILFLTAGKIQAHYKSQDVSQVSGLLRDLPYSGWFFMVGIFALLGLPPFGSFLGELIMMSELIRLEHYGVFTAFCATLTVTFVATARSVFPMIWGASRKRAEWRAQRFAESIPKLMLLVFLVAMGLFLPGPVNALFQQVARDLGGT